MKNLVLFHYHKVKGPRIKQVYFINTENEIKVGNTTGYQLYFYPEGNISNSVITKKDAELIFLGDEIKIYNADLYPL